MTKNGVLTVREPLDPALYERIRAAHRALEACDHA